MTREEYRRLAMGEAGGITGRGSAGEGLTVCARCHGDEGAANGHVPRLAGQKREYLEHALRSYATAERSSGIMGPVAAELSDREIADLAAFYADISDVPFPEEAAAEADPEPDLLTLGERVAVRGVPDGDVPACAGCHGVDGLAAGKDPRFPAIAGQSRHYLELQLRLWRDGAHEPGPVGQLMASASKELTDEHIRALALYYSIPPKPQSTAAAAE
jgi:cytochrome c553